jgi:hypothetical protein
LGREKFNVCKVEVEDKIPEAELELEYSGLKASDNTKTL